MRKIIASVLVLAFWAAVIWAAPKLEVSEENWDFGDVPNVGSISHIFKLTNSGDIPVKIINVVTSCGCTSTKFDNQELKPREWTGLTVTFNASSFPGGGRFVKQITVYTNDTTAPSKIMTIAATVCANGYDWGGVTPQAIDLSASPEAGKPSWKEVVIQNQLALSQKVSVLEKVGLVSEVKVLGKAIASGGKGRIRVKVGTFADPLPPSSITLKLESKDGERRVSIPVMTRGKEPPKRELN